MSGGTFARCGRCQRLNIYGQTCVCDETAPRNCDCTYDGNKQHIGPKCEQRMADVWAETVRIGRARIAAPQTPDADLRP